MSNRLHIATLAMPFPLEQLTGNTRCVVYGCGEIHRDPSRPEVALNQNVKDLIQKLGEAIHESVSESEHIAGVVKNIREEGFDVLLMLEATIGLNEVDLEDADAESVDGETVDGPFTSTDLNFLKSLRISLSDDHQGSGLQLGDGKADE